MNTEQNVTEQRKRRGRPPGSRKGKGILPDPSSSTLQHLEERSPGLGEEDEQLICALKEERLSPFSRLLRNILWHNRAEMERAAKELGVAENTIYRWMNGRSDPRPVHLKKLPDVFADQRDNLIYAIQTSYPSVLEAPTSSIGEVRKDIYRHVLELVAMTAEDDIRFWQVTEAIFEYALLHLDRHRQGLALTYAKVMPPHADGIHSLREVVMRGNYPWPTSLEGEAFLGSTTLACTAAVQQRAQTWDHLKHEDRLQAVVDENERSACACPVMRGRRIAGVLIVSSTSPDFFQNAVAYQSVVEYAQLLALALRDEDFQPAWLLNLRPMPDLKWQRAEIQRSYVNRIVSTARKRGISRQEAAQLVIQDMELEFEDIARHTTKPPRM